MSANPHANGGLLLRDSTLPDFRDYAVEVPTPGAVTAEATRVMGEFLRDVMKLNPTRATSACSARTRRNSNRWQDVLRSHQPRLDCRDSSRTTTISRPTAA